MRIKYRFEIKGDLKPDIVFPLKVNGVDIVFVLEESKIIAIDIFENIELKKLPVFSQGFDGVHSLNMGNTNHRKFNNPLKLAEGLLSPFGLREIITDIIEIEWIPESEVEEKLVSINKFTYRTEPSVVSHIISFDLIARPFIAAFYNSNNYEVHCHFFGKEKMI